MAGWGGYHRSSRLPRHPYPDHETISVPDTELTNNAITRPYGRDRYRTTEQVYVAYDDDGITLAPPSAQSLSGEVTVTERATDPSVSSSE